MSLETDSQDQRRMVQETHLAVCGNSKLGVPGLVKEVRELREWRRKLDLRVAGISGGVTTVLFIAKWLFTLSH